MIPDTAPLRTQVVELPMVAALLTEDRGQLTRRGMLSWEGGPLTATVTGLSPVVVDAAIQARILGKSEVVLGRVAVRRRWVETRRAGEAELAKLAGLAQERGDRLADLDAAITRLEAHSAGVGLELRRYAATVVHNAGRGLGDAARWEADIAAIRARIFAALERASALRADRTAAARAAADVAALIAAAEQGDLRLETALELALDAPSGQAVSVELELRLLLPNALWRPSYEAHLKTGPNPTVAFSVQGTVWQRSGEDWRDIAVTLSTARPSIGARLPPLPEDRLQLRPKTAEERRILQADFRDQVVQTADLVTGASPEALPGVDDGGEVRVLAVQGKVDLPSDGRPHRVFVSAWDAPATSRWLCIPEVDAAVFREVSLSNLGREPLLAGPVALLVDGAYVGVGELPYVAPGEPFVLSFGSRDDVVVRYTRSRKVETRRLQSDLTWFVAEAALHNTGSETLDVEVLGRLPVSELEKVQIVQSPIYTRAGAEGPDAKGHLRWKLRLEPGSRADVGLGFRLELGSGVVLGDPW